MSNTPQYSFLYLIIRHQSPFSTIINFTTILYPNSTKLSNKTSMMKSSLKTQAGEIWLLNRAAVLYRPCYCRKELHGRRILEVLEIWKAEGCSLQACSLL